MKKSCFLYLVGMTSLAIFLLAGCGRPAIAKTGDTVRVHYTGRLQDGTEFDSSIGGEPLEFTLGQGQIITGFEQAVIGMRIGESKTVTIPADQAYGSYDDNMVLEVERDKLPEDLEPEVGMQLQMSQGDGGYTIVTVTEVSETMIRIDANHPLAGKDLTFDIELVEIVLSQSSKTGSSLTSMPLSKALSSGKPTLAEFGRGTCIPCKQMKPILEELAKEYEGKVNILIISVDEYRDLTTQYGIMAIPTQIFFNSSGQEVSRHIGFWPKEEIITQLQKMGIN